MVISRNSKLIPGMLGLGLIALASSAIAKDTTLVTRITSYDPGNQVLALQTHGWSLLPSGGIRQKQWKGEGASAVLAGEQLFDAAGMVTQSEVYNPQGQVIKRSAFYYDSADRLIELKQFIAGNSPPNTVIRYTLREDGQPLEIKATDTAGQVLSILTHTYNDDNRIILAEEKRNDSVFQRVRHFWATDGKSDTLVTLVGGGTDTAEVRVKEFNSKNKIIREFVSIRLQDKSWFARETKTTYDSLDRVTREENFNGSRVLIGYLVYTLEAVSLSPVSLGKPVIPAKRTKSSGLKSRLDMDLGKAGLRYKWVLGRRSDLSRP